MMRRFLAAAVALSMFGATTAMAESPHSDNMSLIGNWNTGSADYQGSDMAFWGNTAVVGMYGGPGGFQVLDIANPAKPTPLGLFDCPGTQADVSIYKDLVIVSVDSPRGAADADGKEVKPTDCGAQGASQAETESGTSWEGLRIVSIADPMHPKQIGTVETDCGSHTHTIIPDPAHNRLIVYVLSYPLGAPLPDCNVLTHRKISIVEVPLSAPSTAKVIGTADVSPTIGCHDVTVFLPRKIAGAGCISESQMWDISDPTKPKVIAHITNPNINIHHSSTFSWDGKTMVLGDELGGAEAAPGCEQNQSGFGGLWFYDVTDPANPVEKGNFTLPQQVDSALCTAHLFNVLPLRSARNILVSSWYEGGTTMVDFTDPAKPKQLAYYIPKDPAGKIENGQANMWTAYWYNGHAYANNLSARGFDVFNVTEPALADEITVDHLNAQVQEGLPAPTATPGAGQEIGLPVAKPKKPKKCVKRRGFKLRVRGKGLRQARQAIVYVGGQRVKVVRGKALRKAIRLKHLPRGRTRIDVVLIKKGGKRVNRSRKYRFC
jgi:hypothetical protein